ncbi:hypothetical protein L1987_78570 [Smallanthus sonchifolius]|uniref:Uncharacterized protein n=1 Tax=Smallanthus sonchifolius TaxID=185202 RepID=A0ACB8ZC42_9ASTR|nr:hypothetical protein L1987_78570 [Smallanthus sonchifolius]
MPPDPRHSNPTPRENHIQQKSPFHFIFNNRLGFESGMLTSGGGGTFYWFRNDESSSELQGIVVIFGWGSIQLKNYINLYSSRGWNSLVVVSNFFNPFFPERATSLAFSVLNELLEELRARPCPLVLASFSGGSQACMYKVFQIIEGTCEAHLNLDDNRLIMMACISGQMYDWSCQCNR